MQGQHSIFRILSLLQAAAIIAVLNHIVFGFGIEGRARGLSSDTVTGVIANPLQHAQGFIFALFALGVMVFNLMRRDEDLRFEHAIFAGAATLFFGAIALSLYLDIPALDDIIEPAARRLRLF